MKRILNLLMISFAALSVQAQSNVTWISTTEHEAWKQNQSIELSTKNIKQADVEINPEVTYQTIDGFGTCFNGLTCTSLGKLDATVRDGIMHELFEPGLGANFNINRMALGANDLGTGWFSYNEVDQDFTMANFSIEHDYLYQIPFIKAVQSITPDAKLWASPWCPPAWMKHNRHYASASSRASYERIKKYLGEDNASLTTYMAHYVENGLPMDREGKEGTDMFILEEPYLKAYALYFGKFIDAYKEEGIDIFMVAPQNEPNSAQIYPSCCWTSAGLNTFIGKYLGPEMDKRGVEVMCGTMERPNPLLCDTILLDSESKKYITSVGFQWAGKDALPVISANYPSLKFYGTEHECGNGKNDWVGGERSWDLIMYYLKNGVNVYTYWNTSLIEGGISRWGWAQNSLIVVSEDGKSFRYSPDYYAMKHLSHYVKPGAKLVETVGDDDRVLAFVNPDNSLVLLVGNLDSADKTFKIKIGKTQISPMLKAHSFNTFVINR